MGWFGKVDGTMEHTRIKDVPWGTQPPKHMLLACPVCGSNRVDLWYVGAGENGGWRVICSDCEQVIGQVWPTEEEAVENWNGFRVVPSVDIGGNEPCEVAHLPDKPVIYRYEDGRNNC